MKTKIFKILTLLLLLLFTVKCNKEDKKLITTAKGDSIKINSFAHKNMRKLKESIYNINSQQAKLVIKNFKNSLLKIENAQAKLVTADSICLDSAIWIIEATLNYDHGNGMLVGGYENYRTDTLELTIPINVDNFKVNSDDIESVYEAFDTSISDSSSSNYKIKFLNLEGYVLDPAISTAALALTVIKYQFQYPKTCPTGSGPFSNSTNYKSMTNNQWSVYFGGSGQCNMINNLPEAIAALNTYKNCTSIAHNCGTNQYFEGFYYNVWIGQHYDSGINQSASGNPYPNELWCTDPHFTFNSSQWWCTLSNSTISGTQLNNYLINQITLANTNVTSPIEVIERKISSSCPFVPQFDNGCSCWVSAFYNSWQMDLTYGTFGCTNRME